MRVSKLQPSESVGGLVHPALESVSPKSLRAVVEALAYPRHYVANRKANERARDWITGELEGVGCQVRLQGKYDNVIAEGGRPSNKPRVLIGAHYDTVSTTPGADDNNSAIAVCLEAARVLSRHSDTSFWVAVFNREEDGLLGSFDFVESLGASIHEQISEAHIFEMVGYYTDAPNSQSKPANLPVRIPSVGNFIGLVSNSKSNRISTRLFRCAERIGGSTPLVALKIHFGLERLVGDLFRSDHTPFWQAGVPAIMWTDTSEFRNPNYHRDADLPETLNYGALADVTRIVVESILD